jgi:hypothetical protein
MQHNHPLIAYAYHFLSEAIIIFLVTLPFFYHRFFFVPYWSYMGIVLGACLIFTSITKYRPTLTLYSMVAPVLFFVFQSFHYPLIMAIVLPIILVWRYVNIRNQEHIKREAIYILITAILTVLVSSLVHDSRVMIYPFLLFVILCVGYILSHYMYMTKKEKKEISSKLLLCFTGILVLGAGTFFLLFDVLRTITVRVWTALIDGTGGLILAISNFLSFITVEKRGWPEQKPGEEAYEFVKPLEDYNVVEQMSGLIILAIIFISLFVLVILLLLTMKKRIKVRLTKMEMREVPSLITIDSLKEVYSNQDKRTFFKRFLRAPEHPVRKMVYQFERKAEKCNKGRKSTETLEDWFNRIGMDTNISVYQRVRYGDAVVSDTDHYELKEQLKKMENKLTANG